MLTQAQLAQRLGVDRSTVSLCFNQPQRVKVATRQRVLQTARDLGYRPNAAARATKRGSFQAVGLLQTTHKFRGYLPTPLLEGIQDALAEHDLAFMLAKLPDADLSQTADPPRILAERMVDGLLVNYTHHAPPALTPMLHDAGVPAVWINTKRAEDCVYPDNLDAADRLTRHLIDLGHRRIGYLPAHLAAVDPDGHFSHLDRLAGYQHAMQQAGLPPRVITADRDDDRARHERLRAALTGPDACTALIVYFSGFARLVLDVARDLDLRVGPDLSLATFALQDTNHLFGGTIMVPPHYELGRAAVRMLHRRLGPAAGDEPTPPVVLPYRLHVGHSTRPPPA
ncbi:MAG: LacI family DNA-binding transcriptional regulator [Planctomycetota bacterium]